MRRLLHADAIGSATDAEIVQSRIAARAGEGRWWEVGAVQTLREISVNGNASGWGDEWPLRPRRDLRLGLCPAPGVVEDIRQDMLG